MSLAITIFDIKIMLKSNAIKKYQIKSCVSLSEIQANWSGQFSKLAGIFEWELLQKLLGHTFHHYFYVRKAT